MDKWKTLKNDKVTEIVKVAGCFDVLVKKAFFDSNVTVKVWEHPDGIFVGKTNLRIIKSKKEYRSPPGTGITIDAALKNTVENLNEMLHQMENTRDMTFLYDEMCNVISDCSHAPTIRDDISWKFFICFSERRKSRSSLYLEFQQGEHSDSWRSDSLYLHVDIFNEMKLYSVFEESIGHLNYWDLTEITKTQWDALFNCGISKKGEIAELFKELSPWADVCFRQYDKIVVLGI